MKSIDNQEMKIDDIKDALQRSGYLLERRISTELEKMEYATKNSPTYIDPDTQKKREYDIESFKYLELDNFRYTIRFIFECKNNHLPIVFFEDNLKYISYLNSINTSCMEEVVATTLNRLGKSRKVNLPISTQYCTFKDLNKRQKNREPDWIAYHENDQFEAFDQIIKASKFQIDRIRKFWSISSIGNRNIEIIYPVMVFQGDLLLLRNEKFKELDITKIKHTIYRFLEVGGNVNLHESFFIDIINESHLVEFVQNKENEAMGIINMIRENSEEFDRLFDRKRIKLMTV